MHQELKDNVYFRNKKYLIFIEDNNYLQFKVIQHLLGLTIQNKVKMSNMAVRRIGGEP